MKGIWERWKKLWIVLGVVFALAVLAWAADQLGQKDAKAQDAGIKAAEMEVVNAKMVKKPKNAPKCDVGEKEFGKKLDDVSAKYQKAVEKARTERDTGGKVSEATKTEVLGIAGDFKKLTDDQAAKWRKCGSPSNADYLTEVGNNRMKSAAIVVEPGNSDKVDELKTAQDKMKTVRQTYVKDVNANGGLSDEDRKDIRANVAPRVDQMIVVMNALITDVSSLLREVQSMGKDVSGAGKGGAMGALSAVKAANKGPQLLGQVQGLLSLVQGMLSNLQALQGDVKSLGG